MTSKLLNEAVELHQNGKLDQAKATYQRILNQEPRNAQAIQFMALIESVEGRLDDAIELIERAIQYEDNHPSFYNNAAGLYRRTGDFDKAIAYFKKAIQLKPDYGEAYQGLVEVEHYNQRPELIDQIEAQLKKPLVDKVASFFHFAAGRIYDNLGEYTKAFPHFVAGNAKSQVRYDSARHQKLAKDVIFSYSKAYCQYREQSGQKDERPLFIVGMPRTGSTMVEQIFASHSKVFAAGELPDIHSISYALQQKFNPEKQYPECMPVVKHELLEAYASSYLHRIRKLAGPALYQRTVDKQLHNFYYVGLIYELFPHAKVIHVQRDAMDTCLSCFIQNFSSGVEFSFNLTSLGEFYRLYQRMMSHWDSVYGQRIIHVRYEDLVADQETHSRKLLQQCELEWEDRCLQFQNTNRDIRTASQWQVRQPVFRRSIGRWKRYRDQLEPLSRMIARPF